MSSLLKMLYVMSLTTSCNPPLLFNSSMAGHPVPVPLLQEVHVQCTKALPPTPAASTKLQGSQRVCGQAEHVCRQESSGECVAVILIVMVQQ